MGVALFRCAFERGLGARDIAFDAASVAVGLADIEQGFGIALVGGALVPFDGAGNILWDALAVGVSKAERHLGGFIACGGAAVKAVDVVFGMARHVIARVGFV